MLEQVKNELEEFSVKYFLYKDLKPSLQKLHQLGGAYKAAAEEVFSIIGKINTTDIVENPFKGISLTNFGEHRIRHCLKYDLTQFSRLITIKDNGIIVLCYAGKHDDCDKWLDKNRGLTLTVNSKGQLEPIFQSQNIKSPETRINTETDYSNGFLYKKIPDRYFDLISEGIKRSITRKFESFNTLVSEEDILEVVCEMQNKEKEDLFFDVFMLLRESKREDAIKRIDLYNNQRKTLENITKEKIEEIVEGDGVIDLSNFDPELIEHLMKTMNYQQWMLFMHPDQTYIVEEDFSGPTKLIGVSGSGKTAIIVRRAVRLAKKYEKERILVLTLNRSLAKLINELVTHVCPDKYRSNIIVKSFWELCRDYLVSFEPDNHLLYNDITWKTNEHIDEIWAEFYLCQNNNDDAKVLLPLHKSLVSRGVYPFEYIKQEFDWTRSAFSPKERSEYLSVERKGRSEAFEKSFREKILAALNSWEEIMKFVGVTDYLGLATALMKYYNKLKTEYRCILVDEEQDLGTIELSIIRKLTKEDENDLFLTGDFAQRVSLKHHIYSRAGIVLGSRVKKIIKNYRNSREILDSAYHILEANVFLEKINDEDFELLDPEYANFSTNMPLILKAPNFQYELGTAINYLDEKLTKNQKGCIAICGYNLSNVKKIGEILKLDVLDGSSSLSNSKIFLSDLEQTKGFEFDSVCILNCNSHVLPNPSLPKEEWYFDVCKLYVAMTRAKTELIISFSNDLSNIFKGFEQYFVYADWTEHKTLNPISNLPDTIDYSSSLDKEIDKMTGEQFLYTKKIIGASIELQNKICSIITGKSSSIDKKPVEWKNIGDALNETNIPNIAQLFGAQKTWKEFKDLFS